MCLFCIVLYFLFLIISTFCFILQIVKSLARKEDAPPALNVILSAINSQSNFNDDSTPCVTCTEPKAIKKCSKCKAVQYCDRECQRLHWFVHKKECARSTTINISKDKNPNLEQISNEISSDFESLKMWHKSKNNITYRFEVSIIRDCGSFLLL